MTTPQVDQLDQELERLFSVTREATAPDAAARERIRAGLAVRLAGGPVAAQPAGGAWLRFGIGAAVVGVGAVALWLMSAPPVKVVSTAAEPRPPVAAAASVSPAPPASPAPVSAPLVSAEPARRARPVAASKPTASSGSADPAEELPLVRAMQQALRSGSSSQALALAAEHARRFPRGNLVEEREGVRAVAQCQSAAPGARSAILSAFTQRFATSPYAARVKAACQ